MIRKATAAALLVFATSGFATAAVGVDVNTPNVRVQVGTPQPPPQVRVIERERVIVKDHEYEGRRDNGKHKGHYKKHKKEKKYDH
jgi:hypothetical protein